MTSQSDWFDWHAPYDDAGSPLSQRLALVQRRIRDTLDEQPDGPIRIVSMCAGQGRDLLGALAGHPRRHDVRARLVELDARNVEHARRTADASGLRGVEIVAGDASLSDAYAGAVPAALVLACGVFGNITDRDIRATIGALPSLCSAGATVIWTRHRLEPDLTGAIRRWFADCGFDEVAFDTAPGRYFSVGSHRLARPPDAFSPGRRFFTFVGREALASRPAPPASGQPVV